MQRGKAGIAGTPAAVCPLALPRNEVLEKVAGRRLAVWTASTWRTFCSSIAGMRQECRSAVSCCRSSQPVLQKAHQQPCPRPVSRMPVHGEELGNRATNVKK